MAVDRQGIVVYFDLLDSLADYSSEEAGELLLAMLRYGTTGEVPAFEDRGMKTLWRSVQQKIDRDLVKYLETVEKRRYAAFCREYKREHGETAEPPSMAVWSVDNQSLSNPSNDESDNKPNPKLKPKKEQKPEQKPEQGTEPEAEKEIESGAGAGESRGEGDRAFLQPYKPADEMEFEKLKSAALAKLGR